MSTPAHEPPKSVLEPSDDSLPEFTPMAWRVSEIRAAIPPHLFVRDTWKGILYLARDVTMAAIAWRLALFIDPLYAAGSTFGEAGTRLNECVRWGTWMIYWWFQGLIFTGIWVIGHECGHGAFSSNKVVCDSVGYVVHTLLWTPYFSWKISHHRHHRNHASMERDEVYVPKTRSDLCIPDEHQEHPIDYEEYFGDTPIYTLYMLIRQQVVAFPAYLLYNVSGQKSYPKWTNHFDPDSILFSPSQRDAVIVSNMGILSMVLIVYLASMTWGFVAVAKYYGIPWLLVSHWFIMITYLHHTDPELPHYRDAQWNFQRGASATVDRDFLGWMGRFFLHDVAHFHVIHHFFPKLPFYHAPEATAYLQAFIGIHYHRSSKPVFKALWDNYNDCQFVDNEGATVISALFSSSFYQRHIR
ncbi:hypothetical protein CERSUDRAFT_58880 [Gelatoporia subvermispora B]|uniref:Fatty acid desaturase domain-containing protein n=1 Tax=Ceriporiopsis subvermispora (strain B) TaxID=914234 RepID=M2P9Z7_CERS8|nr:hypothetical protein CERSUDRAFT_58880 [Gelatoporia subvermispora B]